ncbi:hypothetical protein RRG08_016447 [Elysia crispata]|uniref:Uncharacterized protein n=1 Tax=Elysia crispata TaxID=231223 RepID=A0AAE0Y925_9GAST|nr:hypothetical protein RRG08_016447 [Elysia crispata]
MIVKEPNARNSNLDLPLLLNKMPRNPKLGMILSFWRRHQQLLFLYRLATVKQIGGYFVIFTWFPDSQADIQADRRVFCDFHMIPRLGARLALGQSVPLLTAWLIAPCSAGYEQAGEPILPEFPWFSSDRPRNVTNVWCPERATRRRNEAHFSSHNPTGHTQRPPIIDVPVATYHWCSRGSPIIDVPEVYRTQKFNSGLEQYMATCRYHRQMLKINHQQERSRQIITWGSEDSAALVLASNRYDSLLWQCETESLRLEETVMSAGNLRPQTLDKNSTEGAPCSLARLGIRIQIEAPTARIVNIKNFQLRSMDTKVSDVDSLSGHDLELTIHNLSTRHYRYTSKIITDVSFGDLVIIQSAGNKLWSPCSARQNVNPAVLPGVGDGHRWPCPHSRTPSSTTDALCPTNTLFLFPVHGHNFFSASSTQHHLIAMERINVV